MPQAADAEEQVRAAPVRHSDPAGHARLVRRHHAAFGTVHAHDAALVLRWNETVGPCGTVWHLGDFAAGASWKECAAVFARLNGVRHLIRGNHDTNRVPALPWASPPAGGARIKARDVQG